VALQASAAGVERFQDARFGMFVHWGLYALVGRGEWHMFTDRVPAETYERLAEHFRPAAWDAGALADLAVAAGQRYLTVTSRHHDGFSLYDTELSTYRVTRSPLGRDVLAELAEACRERDLGLGVYVSLVDWHHSGYRHWREPGAWDDYLAFLHGQVTEVCTGYGPLTQVWFDGDWPSHALWRTEPDWFAGPVDFHYAELYDIVHRHQPDAVVLNNRHVAPLPGEDVQGFEQDLPGEDTSGHNTGTPLSGLPLETCLTTNRSWGYAPHDEEYRSPAELLTTLVRAAGGGANLLLNVGPTQSGTVPGPVRANLRAMGGWLREHGDAIYGTRTGPEPPTRERATTTGRDGAVYRFTLDPTVATAPRLES
jgi:alpha-L-fucosidase